MASEMETYEASFREALDRYDLRGFEVVARDGDAGKIDEATYEDPGRNEAVVDTGLFGKKLVLPASAIREIDVENRRVLTDMSREEVKNAPEYDRDRRVDEDLRSQVGGHGDAESERSAGDGGAFEQIRREEPVENTVHNLIQTLSVKLDSAARYGLYQQDARKDGHDDLADVFGRLEGRERESIRDLMDALRRRLAESRSGSEAEREELGSRRAH